MERLWPTYRYDESSGFRPTVLEIGFGMGEATALQAAAEPDADLLAVEVHPAGIAALLRRLDAADLGNVRVVEGDAVELLRALPAWSLREVRIYFPDPWPKARHAKRRLLRPSFASLLAERLAPLGFLHVATDSPAYAEHVRAALVGWEVREDRGARPVTGYERRALAAGRASVDLRAHPPR